jgi:hypothetical protein
MFFSDSKLFGFLFRFCFVFNSLSVHVDFVYISVSSLSLMSEIYVSFVSCITNCVWCNNRNKNNGIYDTTVVILSS